MESLGPSDSSDSGSDVRHERRMATTPDTPNELGAVPARGASTTDASGTGERASAMGDAEDRDGEDLLPGHADDIAEDSSSDDETDR